MDIYGNKVVTMIETKLLCFFIKNLADMLAMVRGWTLLILEVKGQGHKGHIWTNEQAHEKTSLMAFFNQSDVIYFHSYTVCKNGNFTIF